MESVIQNTGAWPIDPLALSMECETGCYRAIPDNDTMVTMLETVVEHPTGLRPKGIQIAEQTRKHYDWDKTAQVWIDHFKSIPLKDEAKTWLSPPRIVQPDTTTPPPSRDVTDIVSHMFTHVLGKPEWIGGHYWAKVVKDLTFGYRVHNAEDDYYFNESHMPKVDKYQSFKLENAAKEMSNLRIMWNNYEQLRGEYNAGRM